MKTNRFSFLLRSLSRSLLAVLSVALLSALMLLIGRDTLGEAVIALLYLLPVAWSATQWGQLPAISTALTAALAFDFLFIPPFYTFAIARLEGWLVLAIFLGVAVVVVGRIQASLTRARESVFMYELSAALGGARTQAAVAHTVAHYLRQLFHASHVKVMYETGGEPDRLVVNEPADAIMEVRPDRDLPVLNSWGLVGEIQIWRGVYTELPPEDGRLLQNFCLQTARAFERTRAAESASAAPAAGLEPSAQREV